MNFWERWRKSIFWVLGTVFACLVAAYTVAEPVQNFLMLGVETVNPPAGKAFAQGNYEFSRTWSTVIVILIVVIATGVYAAIVHARRSNGSTSSESELVHLRTQYQKVREEYDSAIQNGAQIIRQFYPAGSRPLHHFSEINSNAFVDRNGDTTFTTIYEIGAKNEPIHFFSTEIFADPEADPVSLLNDISFEANDLGVDNVVYQLTQDQPRVKEVWIVFLPQIPPNGKRRIEVKYSWPGFSNRFLEKGEMEAGWGASNASPDTTCDLRYAVDFHKELGDVSCENRGSMLAGATLVKTKNTQGGTTWIYSASNVQLSDSNIHLFLKKV
jgi:hypothetical protein|tara:strand:- start:302 stop:1282 length:981 start_codon:yes stop_codon:yes gene_type:complete